MRLLISIPLFLVAFSAVALGQLRFDATEKDFGDMRPMQSRSLEFRVYNDGHRQVRLAEPRPSCGCTATLLEDAVLEPGDSTVIGVRFSASPGMMGSANKTIAINVIENGEEKHAATLRITARVVGDVIYEPGLQRFSAVVGDTVRLPLTLKSNAARTVTLDNISASLLAYVDTSAGNTYDVQHVQTRPFTAFTLSLASETLPPGDSTELTLVLLPGEKGQINGSIRISLPNAELRVPVTGVVLRTRAP